MFCTYSLEAWTRHDVAIRRFSKKIMSQPSGNMTINQSIYAISLDVFLTIFRYFMFILKFQYK